MKYWKCTYYNGFCGCDEDFYYTAEDEDEAEELGYEYRDMYSFAEPDSRFCDPDDEDEVDDYYDGISFEVEEISKEEFEENS